MILSLLLFSLSSLFSLSLSLSRLPLSLLLLLPPFSFFFLFVPSSLFALISPSSAVISVCPALVDPTRMAHDWANRRKIYIYKLQLVFNSLSVLHHSISFNFTNILSNWLLDYMTSCPSCWQNIKVIRDCSEFKTMFLNISIYIECQSYELQSKWNLTELKLDMHDKNVEDMYLSKKRM